MEMSIHSVLVLMGLEESFQAPNPATRAWEIDNDLTELVERSRYQYTRVINNHLDKSVYPVKGSKREITTSIEFREGDASLNMERHHLSERVPAILTTSRLKVSLLQSTWKSEDANWLIEATLTDPADERLFKSLSDLSAMQGDSLRQTPSRHWWIGFKRQF